MTTAGKTVVIFGAGAVRAAAGKRPLKNSPPLDRDFFEIARKLHPSLVRHVEAHLRSAVGGYAEEVLQSLETTATLLYLKAIDSGRNTPPHRAFLGLLTLLGRVLGDTTNKLRLGPRSLLYRFLLQEIKQLPSAADLTVITFNYDLVLERVLDEIQSHRAPGVFAFPQCYRIPRERQVYHLRGRDRFRSVDVSEPGIALLKLHGSLNWQSSHTSSLPTPRQLFNVKRELKLLNLTDVEDELTYTKAKRRSHLRPIILPPITGKRGLLHKDLGVVWARAADALRAATRLVVFGYSCPPLDLEARMLIGEMVRDKLQELVIINPDARVASRFIALCGCRSAHVVTQAEAVFS